MKLKVFFLTFNFIIIFNGVFSQSYFNKLHGEQFLYSSLIEFNNGYIAIGDIFAPVNKEIVISRINYDGDTLWQKILGSYPKIHGSIQIIPIENGFLIAGIVKDTAFAPDVDIILASFDNNGDSLWYKRYGGPSQDVPSQIQITSDGGFIIAGTTDSYGSGMGDFYLIKTDSLGNLLWQQTYGGGGQILRIQ